MQGYSVQYAVIDTISDFFNKYNSVIHGKYHVSITDLYVAVVLESDIFFNVNILIFMKYFYRLYNTENLSCRCYDGQFHSVNKIVISKPTGPQYTSDAVLMWCCFYPRITYMIWKPLYKPYLTKHLR